MEEATMTHSQEIGELVKALCSARLAFPPIPKNRINPHFKSKYADINDILTAIMPILSEHGLIPFQSVERVNGQTFMATKLVHSSGQWIKGLIPIIIGKQDMQGVGSSVTYSRRFGVTSLLGLSSDDDLDGEETRQDRQQPVAQVKPPRPHPQPAKAPQPPVGNVYDNDDSSIPF